MKYTPASRKLTGFLFTSATGTLLHFLYDLTGQSVTAAFISAVNESIWEHMKLIFYPMLLFSLIESRFVPKENHVFRCISLAGILLALVLIPVLYYTYTGMLGVSADWFNITIFFLAAGAAWYLEFVLESRNTVCRISPSAWLGILLLISAIFTAATFFPPRIPLFQDPLTGTYGR